MHRILLGSTLLALSIAMVLACGNETENPLKTEVRSTKTRVADPTVADGDFEKQMAANNDFALALGNKVRSSQRNTFISGASVSTALAMTYAGASGDNIAQMRKALRFSVSDDALHAAFNKLDLTLTQQAAKHDKVTFDMSNALWGHRGHPFAETFLDTLATNYGAGMRLVDYVSDREGARQAINAWVKEKTADRIVELVPKGALTRETRLVLTNTVYFKAPWRRAFTQVATRQQAFAAPQGSVQVDMMHEDFDDMLMAKSDAYDAIELPYADGKFAMLVIVPKAGTLETFEDSLDNDALETVLGKLESKRVHLALPSFTFKSKHLLKPTLTKMGMPVAFDCNSTQYFLRMSAENYPGGLCISEVVHETFIKVDEDGSEAAGATAVIMADAGMAAPVPVEKLTVDRPFIFMIRDRTTRAVLFSGRVLDPSQN